MGLEKKEPAFQELQERGCHPYLWGDAVPDGGSHNRGVMLPWLHKRVIFNGGELEPAHSPGMFLMARNDGGKQSLRYPVHAIQGLSR